MSPTSKRSAWGIFCVRKRIYRPNHGTIIPINTFRKGGLIMPSIWRETSQLPSFERLEGDKKCDVLIIGGGMAGILLAYLLDRQGTNYILVEKDKICGGTTGNTTAKITYQHGLIYDKLIKSLGKNAAQGYYLANRDALERLCKLAEKCDCGLERKDSYVYTTSAPEKIERELEAMKTIGCRAEYAAQLPLPIYTECAVKVKNQAQFNPLQFISHIAKDLNIYENTFVKEMRGRTAITEKGKIRADKVVVCTHFPFINKHGSYFLKLYQHRSYVIALKNAADVGGMYLDENKSGLSFRNYKEYLLLGGGSHRTGKQGGSYQELRSIAKEKYPQAQEVCHWAAQDCMSLDGMPYIGRYSQGSTGLYTATGFNKWGMTGSMLSALMLSTMVSGGKSKYSELFSPSRSMLRPQLIANGFEATVSLLTPTAKRCPHLGCALKWNPVEHSWDCPCHGSRFTKDGRVIENPANGDLKK